MRLIALLFDLIDLCDGLLDGVRGGGDRVLEGSDTGSIRRILKGLVDGGDDLLAVLLQLLRLLEENLSALRRLLDEGSILKILRELRDLRGRIGGPRGAKVRVVIELIGRESRDLREECLGLVGRGDDAFVLGLEEDVHETNDAVCDGAAAVGKTLPARHEIIGHRAHVLGRCEKVSTRAFESNRLALDLGLDVWILVELQSQLPRQIRDRVALLAHGVDVLREGRRDDRLCLLHPQDVEGELAHTLRELFGHLFDLLFRTVLPSVSSLLLLLRLEKAGRRGAQTDLRDRHRASAVLRCGGRMRLLLCCDVDVGRKEEE